jgi:uncharacterized membrane protein YdjX (TVP38/TMEM64 family)
LSRSALARLSILAALALAGAWLLFRTPLGPMLASAGGRAQLFDRMNGAVRAAGPLGPLLFVGIMTAGLLVLPATPFIVAGVLLFGRWAGSAYVFAAAVLSASASFALGRYFLQGVAHRLLTGRLAELNARAEAHGFSVIFYLRLAWFPFIVLNYAASATRIRFPDYFWGTVLGGAAPFFIASFCLGSIGEIAKRYRGPADLLHPDLFVAAALLGVSLLLPKAVRRIRAGRREDGKP